MGNRQPARGNSRRRRIAARSRAHQRRGGRSPAACGSSPSWTSATDGRCGCF
jgi:hypothetical protein